MSSLGGTAVTKKVATTLVEAVKRYVTALNLYRSQPHQDPIFLSEARELLVRGGVRAGKSLSLAALIAAICKDEFITLSNGQKVRARRPHQIGRTLRVWVIGYDQRHIGETLYRLLFEHNQFKIIVDQETHMYRAYDFSRQDDLAREADAKPAPPFIPKSWCKDWDWENKGNKEFKKVDIVNPKTGEHLATIHAYSSKAEPKQGDPCDVIWVDEAIKYPKHYEEWQSRLADRRGRLVWSSWPRGNNSALRKITKRAKECLGDAKPMVQEFVISTSANKQLDPEGKRELLAGFDEETLAARDRGEYLLENLKMYPVFDPGIHCAILDQTAEDEISKILRRTNGQPPNDWTRELVLDPGTNHPAVLFCAIPPLHLGNYYIVYDELYPGRRDAVQLAPMVKVKMANFHFHRFIIDSRAGKQKTMGFSISVAENYSAAFENCGIKCKATGSKFTWGSPDVGARIEKLRSWMHLNEKGLPKIRIVINRCPNLVLQLQEYVMEEKESEGVGDRPADGQKIDLAQALEYFCASGPKYFHPPENSIAETSEVMQHFLKMKAGRDRRSSSSPDAVTFGPGYSQYKV